jgi:hypothetical protein
MIFDHRKMLDELLISKNGIEVSSIHFVSNEILERETKEQLLSIGLETFEPIYFSILGDSYPEKKGAPSLSKVKGATICFRDGQKVNQVILLQKEIPKDINIQEEYQDDWKALLHLCALLHEFGHADDMQKSINFSFSGTPTVKLIEAEAYAHVYTLNHLNKMGATLARNLFADMLQRLNQSEEAYGNSLYQKVCSSIGKERLQAWAKA